MIGNYNSSPQPKPFGVGDQMTASNQQAVPVAYVAGTRKVAPTFITGIYGLRAQQVKTAGGGGGGGGKGGKGGGK